MSTKCDVYNDKTNNTTTRVIYKHSEALAKLSLRAQADVQDHLLHALLRVGEHLYNTISCYNTL